eukprot:m.434298 g.434298  ORF g.434298 m.434298 type:complete len:236 (+) comp17690_c0_seq1:136-843(+)
MITLTPDAELAFNLAELEKNKTVAVELKIANNSSTDRVLFKIKTTKPQNYHVKPNSGIIPAGGAVTIQVALLEAAVNQPSDSKAKEDKFLVQTVLESDCKEPLPKVIETKEEATIVKERWTVVEAQGKNAPITKNKLTCRLLHPEQSNGAAPAVAKPPPSSSAAATPPASGTVPTKPTQSSVTPKATTPAASKPKPKPAPAAVETKTAGGDQTMPSIMILFVVFLLGVIMGKFAI